MDVTGMVRLGEDGKVDGGKAYGKLSLDTLYGVGWARYPNRSKKPSRYPDPFENCGVKAAFAGVAGLFSLCLPPLLLPTLPL